MTDIIKESCAGHEMTVVQREIWVAGAECAEVAEGLVEKASPRSAVTAFGWSHSVSGHDVLFQLQ